ncbi:cupredoxin domain-containing protein [Kiloniella laminariae]|uniref:Cupredoxin domain-containing protein n=1 Tax=Kiloniella laminariae TaxID=454162 RepID=A0ABT4LF04_9PROT|nr:cupredoxin domain-containing protein [Kiloniella laminariae]MCZ4279679.1 cupredoxin domain-containing protein [Kiloniella laminariae]
MSNVDTRRNALLSSAFGFSAVLGLVLSFGLASPGFADATHGETSRIAIGEAGVAAEVTTTIEISLQDNYFEPEHIGVKENETVRFVIRNNGEFVHEFNIGTAAMHAAHQSEMEMMVNHGILEADRINRDMMHMDMGNGQTMEHNDPNSVLLEPGETAEIIWKFSEAAELEFACNVPGHYDSGMMGDFKFTPGS